MKTRTIPAGEFKAKCLALLDEVAETGQEIVVTKRGKPVARLRPFERLALDDFTGTVLWAGDVESPACDWPDPELPHVAES